MHLSTSYNCSHTLASTTMQTATTLSHTSLQQHQTQSVTILPNLNHCTATDTHTHTIAHSPQHQCAHCRIALTEQHLICVHTATAIVTRDGVPRDRCTVIHKPKGPAACCWTEIPTTPYSSVHHPATPMKQHHYYPSHTLVGSTTVTTHALLDTTQTSAQFAHHAHFDTPAHTSTTST